MGPAAIVVSDPFLQDLAQVAFTEWNHAIQALAADGPNQALAIGIRLGRANGRLEALLRQYGMTGSPS